MMLLKPTRGFTSLLMPLPLQPNQVSVPAEIENPLQSTAAYVQLQLRHSLFNEECARQLEEMNKNVISNIISRGGNKGWTTADNLDDLTKQFQFRSSTGLLPTCRISLQ
jgi:hypothetical protein